VRDTRAEPLAARVAFAALAAATIAAFFLVDTRAEAAFDAPKRAAVLSFVAVATAAALVLGGEAARPRSWRALPMACRLSAALLAFALAAAPLAALLSPRRPIALHGLRVVLLYACLLPLGASRTLTPRRVRTLLAVFLGAAVVSSAIALLQASGLWQPVPVAALAGRTSAFALIGNEGVLALALALAGVGALGVALSARGWTRVAALAATSLLLAGIAVTQSLAALLALLAGGVLLVLLGAPRRRAVAVLALVALAGGAAVLPPVTTRIGELAGNLRGGRIGEVTSDRLGAWAAAVEMVRERPLVGFGPGTFGAEFAPHRVKAELRLERRLVHQKVTGAFSEAHDEPLQAAAELGVPAAGAALGAVAALLAGLVRRARAPDGPARAEAVVVLSLLVAGSLAAVLWFPLQREVTALPLLLAAGRGWRLLAGEAG
jgi:O-antigen ligase